MKYFLYFLFFCGNAIHKVQPAKPYKFSLGPIGTIYKIGNLSERYNPLSLQDQTASANILDFVENEKKLFANGSVFLPPLDPFSGNNYPPITVDGLSSLVSGDIYLKYLKVTGAKQIQINSIEVRLNTLRIDCELEIPMLEVNAKTEADLTISAVIPVSIDARIKAKVRKIKLKLAAQLVEKRFRKKRVYQISALYFIFHADRVNALLASSSIDDSMIDMLKSFESNSDMAVETIRNYIAKEAILQVNKILRKFTTDQIKEIIFKLGSS